MVVGNARYGSAHSQMGIAMPYTVKDVNIGIAKIVQIYIGISRPNRAGENN